MDKKSVRFLETMQIIKPEIRAARDAIHGAVKRGSIERPLLCSACGCLGKIDAHHDDHSKQLEVRWLCKACHLRHHQGKELRSLGPRYGPDGRVLDGPD